MIDRRQFLRALLGGAGALALVRCGGSPEAPTFRLVEGPLLPPSQLAPASRPTVRMPGADLGLVTPFGYHSPPGYFFMVYLYDSLLWTDSTGQLVSWLATSMPERSPDGLTYRFEVRDGVRFHDGRPLTNADVAFTFEYFAAKKPMLAPFLLFQPEHLASVRTVGPRGVEFRLDKPAVTFLEAVAARVPIIPRHVWSSLFAPNGQDKALAVGSGPYRLEEFSGPEGRYLFVANDDFFLGRPFVSRIEARQVGDPVSALLAGEIDVAGLDQPTPEALGRLHRQPELGMASGPPDFLFALYWNLEKGGALADVRFRRACAHAIDRADIVRRLAAGLGEVGNPGFLPQGHPFRVEVEQYGYDPRLAERLLDEAGYRRGPNGVRTGPDGTRLRFRLQTLPVARVSRLVSESLRRVGIEVEVDPVDMVGFGDFEMAILVYGGQQGDPDHMRLVYSSRAQRQFFRSARGYVNPELDDLADRQLVALDEAERREIVAQMQHIVAADLPLLHLYYPAGVFVHRKTVLDQVAVRRNGIGPLNKQALVTGVGTGGTEIRPTV